MVAVGVMAASVALGFFGAGSGCSLILDASAEQCQQSSDCAKFNQNALYVCENNACVRQTTDASRPVGPTTCTTNQECQTVSVDNVGICDLERGECVQLKSRDCGEIIGDVNSDNVLILGALAPRTLTNERMGVAVINALTLAAGNDFTQAKASLPRPIAVVVCDDASEPVRAATHLISTLKVPAIIAAGTAASTRIVAAEAAKSQVFVLSPTTTTAFASADPPVDIWHTVPSDDDTAAASFAALASLVEANVPADGGAGTKWAIVHKADDLGNALSAALVTKAPFASAARISYGNPDNPQVSPARYAGAIADLKGEAPNAIIVIGNAEAARSIIGDYESQRGSAPAPFYVATPTVVTQDLLTAATAGSFANRVVALVPGRTTGPIVALETQFTTTFNQTDGPNRVSVKSFGMAQTYDAFYSLALAASTLTASELNSANLKTAFAKLTSGASTNVDPQNILQILTTLREGGSVDLEGASGPLDFSATGAVTAPWQLLCISGNDFQASGVFVNGTVGGSLNGSCSHLTGGL